MAEQVVYAGRDLEAMSFARNYHRWILDLFAPHLGARLVEVGAGTGSFSELILARPGVERLALVEPSREMYAQLAGRVASLPAGARVTTHNATFRAVADELARDLRPDSIIYVNVLEHIEDDEGELAAVRSALAPGGRAFVFVPAFASLYGSFDRQIGHQRRYTRRELEGKCARAGLRVRKSVYFDSAGVLPWWLKYRVLRSEKMEPGMVRLYDELVVPALRRIETVVAPPFGKNVLLVADKV